jgi:hypothetical protein
LGIVPAQLVDEIAARRALRAVAMLLTSGFLVDETAAGNGSNEGQERRRAR